MTQSPVQQRRQGRIELGESDEAQFSRIVGQFWGRGVARARIRGTIRNLSDERRLIFSEVRTTFNENMNYTDVSKCAFLIRVIESSKYTPVEKAERDERQCANACMPLPDDVVLHLHRTLWEESGMSVKGLSLKGMWVTMVIILIRGSRITNCVDTIADHAMKVESITIYYSTIALTIATYKGGDTWPEGLSMDSAQRVDMRFLSSKDSPMTKPLCFQRSDDKWALMGTIAITEWLRIQSPYNKKSDLVTTSFSWRPDTKFRQSHKLLPTMVQPAKINKAIKEAAQVYCLDGRHFSSRSFRKRIGTLVNEGRIIGPLADMIGGWTAGSQTRLNKYTEGSIRYVGIGDEEAISIGIARETMMSHGRDVSLPVMTNIIVAEKVGGKKVGINVVPTVLG